MSTTTVAERGVAALEKAEVRLGNTGLQLRNIDELFRFAQAVAGSALAPKDFVGKPESVLVAIQMGMEIGLPPMAALQNIAVINGRPSVWGDAQLAVVRATGELEAFEETETNNEIELIFRELCFEEDTQKRKALKIKLAMAQANMKKDAEDYGVSCFVRRSGFNEAFSRFTVADAKTAGLWKKQGPWTNYPSRMLKSRARSFLLRDQFGDALKGMMSREEAGDIIDISGVTVDVPKAEAVPGPVGTPFRRKTQAEPAPEPEPKPGQLANPGRPPEQEAAERAALERKNKPIEVQEVKENPTVAAPAPTAPVAEASAPQSSEPSAPPAEAKKSSEPKVEFVLPPAMTPADWQPNLLPSETNLVRDSLMEWIKFEGISEPELIAWCIGRGIAREKQTVADLAVSKLNGILKARESSVRGEILKARTT